MPSVFKSRPVYRPLAPQPGHLHIFLADGDGALAILDLARRVPQDFFAKAHLLYVPTASNGPAYEAGLAVLAARSFDACPAVASALLRLERMMAFARMGTRLYLAGSEGLIGQAWSRAVAAGMEPASIEAVQRGSLARRVQCVHCKTISENVTLQPAVCTGCGLTLYVRDHFSRRIGAFQGVCIDAEEPGTAPPAEEAFA